MRAQIVLRIEEHYHRKLHPQSLLLGLLARLNSAFYFGSSFAIVMLHGNAQFTISIL